MKIAIPLIENNKEESRISEHFGRAPYFAFVELKDNKTYSFEIEENPFQAHSPGDIPEYLHEKNVELIVVRNIGKKALDFFEEYNIKVIKGVDGNLKEIIQMALSNELKDQDYTEDSKCCHE
ncbi:MAG TPA: NifB/NifX family molybdenum-iron cluster-binding protein [Defluviitoga sp.]|nr:NifB/NifX family molybdenum-iron cluster-binding protein [Defluviitoga sp.]